MCRKIIDDYWFSYLNDLFEIKLTIQQSELNEGEKAKRP